MEEILLSTNFSILRNEKDVVYVYSSSIKISIELFS